MRVIGYKSYAYDLYDYLYGAVFMSITEADRLAHEQRGEFLKRGKTPEKTHELPKMSIRGCGTYGHAGRVYRR